MKNQLLLSIFFILIFETYSYTIREIDNNILWINVPVDADEIKSFMTPELKPSIYNNKAWISIKLYNVASIKSNTLGVWIDMPFSTGLTATISILVETNFDEKGYLLLSYDANSGITGTIRTLSCINYQVGVKCETAKTINLDNRNMIWISKNSEYIRLKYETSSMYDDSDFIRFIMDRPHKFEKNAMNETYVNYQKEKENPNNYIIKSIDLKSLSSNILFKKLGIKDIYDKDMCTNNTCFWSNFYQVDDEEMVEYKNRIPLMFYKS